MDRIFRAFGNGVVRFRWLVLAGWVVFAVLCFALFPSISSVEKDQTSGFLPNNSPSIRAEHLASTFQNINYAQLTFVAARAVGRLTASDQAAISRFEQQIRRMRHVLFLQDLGTSPDGAARQAQIQAAVPTNGSGTAKTLVDTIRADFARAAPAGLTYHLTGDTPITVDTRTSQSKSNGQTNRLSFLVIIVLLLLAFRAVLAPIITIITSAIALVLGQQVIAEATHIGVQVSNITSAILIVLILGAGTDYGVFLMFRVREEMRNGLEPSAAVAQAISTVGESITFSALTVIVALLSLLVAQFGFYQSLGAPLAIGIALMLVAGLTFLPAVLAILGRAVFWPSQRTATNAPQAGWWGRIAARIIAFPLGTLVAGLILFVGLASGNLGVATAGFGGSNGGPAGTDSAAGQNVIKAHYPGSSTYPEAAILTFRTSVWQSPTGAARAQSLLAANPAFRSVLGPFAANGGRGLSGAQIRSLYRRLGAPQTLSPVQAAGISPPAYNAYRASAQFISRDGRTVQYLTTPRNNDIASASALNAVPALRTAVANVAKRVGAQQSGLFGFLAFGYDIDSVSSDDLHRIIPLVAILIAVLLAAVVRSLVAPLYLVVSVVLSYLAALGLAAIIFVRLGGQSGLNFVLPFIMFIFLMALGSDYNILVMARIREEANRFPLRVAVRRAIGATGTTVTTAGTILGGTFAVLGVTAPAGSEGDQLRQLGYGIAAGILMDTFLVRTLLVPAVVILLGRFNWWPSSLWHREIPEPEAEEGARPVVAG